MPIHVLLAIAVPGTSRLPAQDSPLPPNRVLDLDGAGDWMRLPPEGFARFEQATIEAWVKWRSNPGLAARVFDFGATQREMYVSAASDRRGSDGDEVPGG